MTNSNALKYPPLRRRLYSVWYRHMRVYTKNILSNALPPFLEPLIFLVGIGLGLGKYITESMGGVRYIEFLGAGLLVTTAMYTSAFECSFGTFVRLEFEKVYDGMLAAPMTVNNLIVGEMLWAGSKGFFFSFIVLCILWAFGIIVTLQLTHTAGRILNRCYVRSVIVISYILCKNNQPLQFLFYRFFITDVFLFGCGLSNREFTGFCQATG